MRARVGVGVSVRVHTSLLGESAYTTTSERTDGYMSENVFLKLSVSRSVLVLVLV